MAAANQQDAGSGGGGGDSMTESARRKFSPLAKTFKRSTFRAKEKMLEHFGKVDRTSDDRIDEQVGDILRQQALANRFSKELRKYVDCAKAMSHAAKSLNLVLAEAYESDWHGADTYEQFSHESEQLWDDYVDSLQKDVWPSTQLYLQQFPAVLDRIQKRQRKLLDYDGSRHQLEDQRSAKKRDDGRLLRAEESLQKSKFAYDELNSELLRTLPRIRDNRVVFYSKAANELCDTELRLHRAAAETFEHASTSIAELARQADEGKYRAPTPQCNNNSTWRPPPPPKRQQQQHSNPSSESGVGDAPDELDTIAPPPPPPPLAFGSAPAVDSEEATIEFKGMRLLDEDGETPKSNGGGGSHHHNQNGVHTAEKLVDDALQSAASTARPDADALVQVEDAAESSDDDVSSAADDDISTPKALEPATAVDNGIGAPMLGGRKLLYRVRATHAYKGEDGDELSFDQGELIYVVEFQGGAEDELDDGWQMGVSAESGQSGVFPENFTKVLLANE